MHLFVRYQLSVAYYNGGTYSHPGTDQEHSLIIDIPPCHAKDLIKNIKASLIKEHPNDTYGTSEFRYYISGIINLSFLPEEIFQVYEEDKLPYTRTYVDAFGNASDGEHDEGH